MVDRSTIATLPATILATLLATFAWIAPTALAEPAEPSPVWIDTSDCGDLPTEARMADLFELAQRHLAGIPASDPDRSDPPHGPPRCLVLLSASDGRERARTVTGRGATLEAAVADAADRWHDVAASPRWLRIDLVDEVIDVADKKAGSLPVSLFGLSTGSVPGIAVLPSDLVLRQAADKDDRLTPDSTGSLIRQLAPADAGAQWRFRFSTHAWFRDLSGESGATTRRLFRGHVRHVDLSRRALEQSVIDAAAYLVANVDDAGRFVYRYHTDSDRNSRYYNILRHAGTAYAMLEVYELSGDPNLLAAAERSLSWMIGQTVACPGRPGLRCLHEDGQIKLGGNGLAVLALAKHMAVTGDRTHLEVAQSLADWMLAAQLDSGEFRPHIWLFPDGSHRDLVSGYYPGEALFGLLSLYRIDGEERRLEAAVQGARWLIEVRDGARATDQLAHDHWLLYALAELGDLAPDERFTRHGLRIARAIIDAQDRELEYPDWTGSFYTPPRSTPTATRGEALLSAWRLARRHVVEPGVESVDAGDIFAAWCRASRFQLQTRFTPASALFAPNPQRVLGAFHESLHSHDIRIDYVQHNISALLGLARVIRTSEGTDTPLACAADQVKWPDERSP